MNIFLQEEASSSVHDFSGNSGHRGLRWIQVYIRLYSGYRYILDYTVDSGIY